mgnify:FL=1
MEINKYTDITGVLTTEAIPEGRMVLMTSHAQTHNYGSREDLPGVKLPDTSTEAAAARFCLTFAVDNTEPPIMIPMPTVADTSFRYGFDGAANVPFNADVHLTPLSNKKGLTIPSGYLALAFGPGVFTVWSGEYVYSANVVPVAFLAVAEATTDSAADGGKLKYSASATFAQVMEVDSDLNLTFRINY